MLPSILQDEFAKTKAEFAKLSDDSGNPGLTNNKQKITYLTGIKQQIHDLVEENQRLRDSAVAQLGKGVATPSPARTPIRGLSATALIQGRKT